MIDIKELPDQLVEGRQEIECNFIISLYKDPDLVGLYEKRVEIGEDVITDAGQFYYGLALGLGKAGYNTFDDMAIVTYLSDKKTAKKKFEEYGGLSTLHEMIGLVNENNVDTYYDSLAKNNFLAKLYLKGFDVLRDLEKFKSMSAEECYDYIEYQINDSMIDGVEKIYTEDVSVGYNDFIEELDKGEEVGYPIGLGTLNYMLGGLKAGTMMLYGGAIGQGKTSSSLPIFIMQNLIEGRNVLVISNEQTCKEYRHLMLTYALFNGTDENGNSFNGKGLNRKKIQLGHFTTEQKAELKKAGQWLENLKGHVQFVELESYDTAAVRKIITKYSKIGYPICIYDVLKPLDGASDRAWAEFSACAETLFQMAKKTKIALVCTFQLAPDSLTRKYLDLSSIGKSRGIAETCHACVMFRPVFNNEYEDLHPYNYRQVGDDGKKIKVPVDLDPEKHYIILFVPKNRSGEVSPQICVQFDMAFMRMKEIGWIDVPFDNFSRR